MAQGETETGEKLHRRIKKFDARELKPRSIKQGKRNLLKRFTLRAWNALGWLVSFFLGYLKFIIAAIALVVVFIWRPILIALMSFIGISSNTNVNHEGVISIEHNIRIEPNMSIRDRLLLFELSRRQKDDNRRLDLYFKCPTLNPFSGERCKK